MIAHSFHGESFGPAQKMHGATYTVDCEFEASELVKDVNWVVDIGEASKVLAVRKAMSDFLEKTDMLPLER